VLFALSELAGVNSMKSTLATASALFSSFLSFSAHSQESQSNQGIFPGWKDNISFSINPRIGKSLPSDSSQDIVDEGEGEIAFTISRPKTKGGVQLQFKFGIISAPQLFDKADPTSALYGEATIGDSYVTVRELLDRSGELSPDVSDAVRPYVRYRFTAAYNDFLDTWARSDDTLTAGVRYRDVRTIMCNEKLPPATRVGACSDTPGVYVEARAEVSHTWSTDVSYRRVYPSLRLDVYSRPLAGGVRIFGWAQGETSFFRDERNLKGRLRKDQRLRLAAGLDLSKWVSRLGPKIDLSISGQYQRRWSNFADKRHERGYFIPSFTFTSPL